MLPRFLRSALDSAPPLPSSSRSSLSAFLSLSLSLHVALSLFFLVRFSPSLFFSVPLFFLLSLSATYFSLSLPYSSLTRYHTNSLFPSFYLPTYLRRSHVILLPSWRFYKSSLPATGTIDSVARSCFSKIVKIFSLEVRKEREKAIVNHLQFLLDLKKYYSYDIHTG